MAPFYGDMHRAAVAFFVATFALRVVCTIQYDRQQLLDLRGGTGCVSVHVASLCLNFDDFPNRKASDNEGRHARKRGKRGGVLARLRRHCNRRDKDITNKTRCGGVCFMVNQSWCTNTEIKSQFCSPDIESLTIKCRPHYLPREFSAVILTAVYIQPRANATTALRQLSDTVTKFENDHPDAVSIVAGDFNHTNMKTVLPKYYQHVSCPTRGDKILDHCYSTIKNAYRSMPRPHYGRSDHSSVFLVPAYRQQLKRSKPVKRNVQDFNDESVEHLQACLEATDWDTFKNVSADLDEYTDTVTQYISFCVDSCIPTRTVVTYPNQKPWFTKDIRDKMHARNEAFKRGDQLGYKTCRYQVINAIKLAKHDYRRKLDQQFQEQDSRRLWHGLQAITS